MDGPVARSTRKRSRLHLITICLLTAGCAAGTGGGEGARGAPPYPDWVRMVPASTDEAEYYVGGCSRASSLKDGVRVATDEVNGEIAAGERVRYMQLFDVAVKDSRASITAIETRRLRNEGGERYAEEAVRRAERVDACHRKCHDDGPVDGSVAGDVCDVFVLVRLGREERNAALRETLLRMREAFRAERNADLAAVAEAMQRVIH